MSEPVETAVHAAGIGPRLKAALEYGPIVGFVAVYLVVREQSYSLWGRDWDGFVLLVGGFVPVVLAAGLMMWRLTGRITPVQVLTLIIMALSGGLTVGLNDERFFKMRTTVVCLTLSAILWVGLARGRAWLEGVMGGMVALSPAGWTSSPAVSPPSCWSSPRRTRRSGATSRPMSGSPTTPSSCRRPSSATSPGRSAPRAGSISPPPEARPPRAIPPATPRWSPAGCRAPPAARYRRARRERPSARRS
jgi:intracellular septation protein A